MFIVSKTLMQPSSIRSSSLLRCHKKLQITFVWFLKRRHGSVVGKTFHVLISAQQVVGSWSLTLFRKCVIIRWRFQHKHHFYCLTADAARRWMCDVSVTTVYSFSHWHPEPGRLLSLWSHKSCWRDLVFFNFDPKLVEPHTTVMIMNEVIMSWCGTYRGLRTDKKLSLLLYARYSDDKLWARRAG